MNKLLSALFALALIPAAQAGGPPAGLGVTHSDGTQWGNSHDTSSDAGKKTADEDPLGAILDAMKDSYDDPDYLRRVLYKKKSAFVLTEARVKAAGGPAAYRQKRLAELANAPVTGACVRPVLEKCQNEACVWDFADRETASVAMRVAYQPIDEQVMARVPSAGNYFNCANNHCENWEAAITPHTFLSNKVAPVIGDWLHAHPKLSSAERKCQAARQFYTLPKAVTELPKGGFTWASVSSSRSPVQLVVTYNNRTYDLKADGNGVTLTQGGTPVFGQGYAGNKKYTFSTDAGVSVSDKTNTGSTHSKGTSYDANK